MPSALTTILPIFALIFAGGLMRRIGVLGPLATRELNRFVVYLALPALLLDIVAHARWEQLWQPGFIIAFGAGSLIVFALTIWMQLRRARHLADSAIDGLNSSYANTGFIGFPLALAILGPESMAPTLIATLITVCILFAVAIVLIETGLQAEKRWWHLALKAAGSLCRNPLLVAPVLGALVPLCGLSVPTPAETFLKLLGGAASPCALVALGLFVAERRTETKPEARSTFILVISKLVLQPGLTWILADKVLALPSSLSHLAVLMAALPTGTGPFMLAEFYGREAKVASNVILISTVLSLFTLSIYLYVSR